MFEGQYRDGNMHGAGTLVHSTGEVKDGTFVDGTLEQFFCEFNHNADTNLRWPDYSISLPGSK